jgi:hypothetical protein
MKVIYSSAIRAIALSVAATVCLQAGLSRGQTTQEPAETAFPYVIPVEVGTWAFAPGDSIKITSLRGNRTHLQADGSYLMEGTYTLASVDKADLLFSCTSPAPGGYSPVSPGQELTVTRGSGTFTLKHPPCDGMYHISFYVSGENHSHGGVYFGEKGVEATILRQFDWPDFSSDTKTEREQASAAAGAHIGTPFSTDPNRAIVAYLGNPVPAPSVLDAKYTPINLLLAFSDLSRKARWRIQSLSVDNSEFPYLVYGVLEGSQEISHEDLAAVKGYIYGGAVVGRADGTTYFAINMIPHDNYPSDQSKSCDRRLMIRLQMLADLARQSK